jgi:hypothetical protein
MVTILLITVHFLPGPSLTANACDLHPTNIERCGRLLGYLGRHFSVAGSWNEAIGWCVIVLQPLSRKSADRPNRSFGHGP